jgi:hypothetical protein
MKTKVRRQRKMKGLAKRRGWEEEEKEKRKGE